MAAWVEGERKRFAVTFDECYGCAAAFAYCVMPFCVCRVVGLLVYPVVKDREDIVKFARVDVGQLL